MYFVTGGDSYGGETGFLGCMRNLYIQGFKVTEDIVKENVGGVVNGSCDLQDRFEGFFLNSFYCSFSSTTLENQASAVTVFQLYFNGLTSVQLKAGYVESTADLLTVSCCEYR